MPKPYFQFDKFIEDLADRTQEKKESIDRSRKLGSNPRRQLDKLYRERWQNRIRWRRI